MKNLVPRVSSIFLLIMILPSCMLSASSQVGDEASIMVGYSKSYMFPFLHKGVLYFEEGEELWAMSMDTPALLTLISPRGEEAKIYLEPHRQTLVKKFGEKDEEGRWILKTDTRNLTMQFSRRETIEDNTLLNYMIDSNKISIEVADRRQEVFIIDGEGDGFLVPAGIEVSIKLPELETTYEQNYSDVVMDLVYPEEFSYHGELASRPYSITMESVAARIVGKLKGNTLTLIVPDLHNVGAGGIIPVREGEAILKIRYISTEFINSTSRTENLSLGVEQTKIYVVNDVYNEWAGQKVAKTLSIDLEKALNKTLKVIAPSGRGVRVYYALIPLTSIVFYDPRLERIVGNLSLTVEGRRATVKNDRAYILLADRESPLTIPVRGSNTTLMVHVFVNGFKTYSGRIQVNRGETYSIPLNLYNLKISVFFPNGSIVQRGILKMNGSRMDFVNSSASYLLPAGSYLVEFHAVEWFGKTTIHLYEDTSLRIILTRHPTILEVLKIVAGLESMILVSTFILIMRLRRIKSKNVSNS